MRISVFTCPLRSDRIFVTSAALFNRSLSDSLRSLRALEIRLIPSNVGPNWGAIRSIVVDSVSSDVLSAAVSVSRVFAVNSLRASVNEYGAPVRSTGMTSEDRSVPGPSDSRVSTR